MTYVILLPNRSTQARNLLILLDTFASDQAARTKRKGKPKQPSPTFHLPYEYWDRSSLPTLRPKDEEGMPLTKDTGIILFRFHVDARVQAMHPEWAQGLYDDPPIPDTDAILPPLDAIVNTGPYIHLKSRVKRAIDIATVTVLNPREIKEVLARPVLRANPFPLPDADAAARDLSAAEEFMSQNLESFEALANNPLAFPDPAIYGTSTISMGPSAGSSLKARRQGKRGASEVAGLAVQLVVKRRREDEDGAAVDRELARDASFLQGLA